MIERVSRERVWTMEEMFRGGALVVDIAERVGVHKATVTIYANRHGWTRPEKVIPLFNAPRGCSKCHRVFPASWFRKSATSLSGRRSACKLCNSLAERVRSGRKRGIKIPEVYDSFTAQQMEIGKGLIK